MLRTASIVLSLLGATILSACWVSASEPIPEHDFQRLHELIRPHPGEEKWAQIPWLTSLWEARKQAAAVGKPILLWEMDGNPLGCT